MRRQNAAARSKALLDRVFLGISKQRPGARRRPLLAQGGVMRYLALVVLLLSAGAAGAAWYTQRSGNDWQAALSLLHRERDRSRELDMRLRQQHDFAVYCEKRLFEVLIGKIRLMHACRDIERYASLHRPAFLEQIDMLGEGRTLREKLANNLAGTFAVRRTEHGGWERDPALALRMVVEFTEATATP
jgi:hypothetical protein